ncbi:electron transport protein SCO1/SenC [Methylobacterium sp. 4-46]|uniref:SCO family protein n=1 Tax=unclassified Methylobacterium TaxID=2615210 RepID=UPI000152CD23|nr:MULTISPECIES: SCO family protein [Methylobacterium]ACA15909.1 electron transport protein SCO1/SenC [Methylobacterium sp. 4-46]WFT81626.1 SCO family protein [Methylobacterium nodulans]
MPLTGAQPHPIRRRARRVAALALLLGAMAAPGSATEIPARPALRAAPPASPLAGHFALRDPSGRSVESEALTGRPYGLFFGFTHCPDICPTTLAQLSLALRAVPDPELRIYFVTVDPERDTPAALAAYMTGFDPRIVALTGERPAIDEAIEGFGITAERVALPGGDFTYAHSAAVLLVDENGLIVDRVAVGTEPEALAARLARVLAKAGP